MSIDALAERVLRAYWDGLLPVNVEAIARAAGCDVRPGPADMRESGRICLKNGRCEILYNPGANDIRRRFTIAHELGHHFLGHLEPTVECLYDTAENYRLMVADPKERAANIFAVSLLLPRDAVKSALARMHEPSMDSLAALFGVSRAALAIRLKSMGILPRWLNVAH